MSRISDKRPFLPVNIAVLTVSDTRTPADDTSGDLLVSRLEAAGHRLAARAIVKDEMELIAAQLRAWIEDKGVDAVITTGGTGLTGRDVTPEAFALVCEIRAHALHGKLVSENLGIGDIADSEGVHHSYVSRLIRLAFLSPEITEAILDGRQPIGLTAAKLMRVSRLPLEWRAQQQAIGLQ